MLKPYKVSFWVLSFCMWIYIITRAIISPFVFDEATTFFLYVQNNKILPGVAYWSANNHLLNSILTRVSYILLGPEEWQLRLPNVLAFLIFSFFLYKISLKLKNGLVRWGFVIATLTSHVFIEMFGFSRGYGLSFSALAAAIYFLLAQYENGRLRNQIYFFIALALMLSANLTLLPLAFTMWCMLLWQSIQRKENFGHIIGTLISGLLPIAGAVWMSLSLKAKGELYYASQEGFFKGSLGSLLEAFTDGSPIWVVWFLVIVMIIIFMIVKGRSYKVKQPNSSILIALLLCLTPFVFYPLVHVLVGVNYPLDRALLYVPFLIILAFSFLLNSLELNRKMHGLAFVILVSPFVFSFVQRMSLSKATGFKWNTEQIPDRFFDTVSKAKEKKLVGGYFLRQICWEYLNFKSGTKNSVLQIADYPGNVADFQIVNDYDSIFFKEDYDLIDRDENSGLLLYESRNDYAYNILNVQLYRTLNTKEEFVELMHVNLDSVYNPIEFQYSAFLESKEEPFRGLICFSVLDEFGEQVLFDVLKLRYLYPSYEQRQRVYQHRYYANKKGAKSIKVFLWNKEKQDYTLEDFEVIAVSKTLMDE